MTWISVNWPSATPVRARIYERVVFIASSTEFFLVFLCDCSTNSFAQSVPSFRCMPFGKIIDLILTWPVKMAYFVNHVCLILFDKHTLDGYMFYCRTGKYTLQINGSNIFNLVRLCSMPLLVIIRSSHVICPIDLVGDNHDSIISVQSVYVLHFQIQASIAEMHQYGGGTLQQSVFSSALISSVTMCDNYSRLTGIAQ